MKLSLSFSQRVILLVLLLLLGLILSGGMQFLLGRISDNAVAVARISAVCQGFLAFILPAVVLALFVTRLPAEFLMIKRFPNLKSVGLSIGILLVSFPAIEWINSMCEFIHWPNDIWEYEAMAEEKTMELLNLTNIPNMLVSILVVGVLTGLAEELFFRGALMRVFQTRPMSAHAAVWITAVVFSLMHVQAVGFISRMLLGALFGYAAIWTGSLWTAIILHIINNTCVILTLWIGLSIPDSAVVGVISIVMAVALMRYLYRVSERGVLPS